MKSLLWILAGIAIINLVLLGYLAVNPVEVSTQTSVVEVKNVEYNDTEIKESIAKIQATLDKEENWEAEAIKLAEAEYSKRHFYNALIDLGITDLDDKSDIQKWIIKDTEVSDADADDKDATVEQEIRVYYENSEGDTKRVTLIVTSEIVEGEVEDTDYELK